MMYFDVSKVETMLKKSLLWNVNKPAIISFNRKDYHGDQDQSLDTAVRTTVLKKTGVNLKGPIRLLTHLRYFGYCFNPVSFYYCFDEYDNDVELVMAEVTNTPWQERYTYIISDKTKVNDKLTANMNKDFHVSPFWGMDHDYEWIFTQPQNRLLVNMKNFKDEQKVFDATLTLNRIALNSKNLIIEILRFPFLTARIVFRIHWQALKLWIKGAKFYVHPKKIKVNTENK